MTVALSRVRWPRTRSTSALAQVLSEFGVGSIGWTRGAAERPLPPGEPDLLGGGDPGPAVAAVTGASALLMDAVEGDAPGKRPRGFPDPDVPGQRTPPAVGRRQLRARHAPGRYKEQLAFLERAHAEGALDVCADERRCRPRPCSSWRSITALMPCQTGSIRSWGRPKSGWPNCRRPGVRDLMRQEVGAWTGSGGGADVGVELDEDAHRRGPAPEELPVRGEHHQRSWPR